MNNDFWKIYPKEHFTTKYQELRDKIALVIYPDGTVIITRKALELIGNPKRVIAVSNESNLFGFLPADDNNRQAYAVSRSTGRREQMPRVACKMFVKALHLLMEGKQQIYLGQLIRGAVVFDRTKPFRIVDFVSQKFSPKKAA